MTTSHIYMPNPTPEGVGWITNRIKVSISEEGVIDAVAKLSPWIAPLPSAFFVYEATLAHLTEWTPLAVVIALVIETLGLTTIHTALGFRIWNRMNAESPEKQAPFVFSCVLAGMYVVATLLLILGLEFAGETFGAVAPAMFPIMALVGAINLAMRSQHNVMVKEEQSKIDKLDALASEKREEERENRRNDRELKRKDKELGILAKYGQLPSSQAVNPTVNPTVNIQPIDGHSTRVDSQNESPVESKTDHRRRLLIDAVKNDPSITMAELKRQLGVGSVNTIKSDIQYLSNMGILSYEERVFTVL